MSAMTTLFGGLRKALFWSHLVVALAAGVLLAWVAITGCLLAFQPQLERLAEASVRTGAPAASCNLAPVLAATRAQTGQLPVFVQEFAEPGRPVLLTLADARLLLVDPCAVRVLGPASPWRQRFEAVENLHRRLTLTRGRQDTLRQLKNAAVLAFLFLIVSGLVLWLPRQLRRASLSVALTPRPGLRGRARLWNLHQVAGFWVAVPMLFLAVSGVVISYAWARNLVYRAAGSPELVTAAPRPRGGDGPHTPTTRYALLDPLMEQARAQQPHWQALQFAVPSDKDKTLNISVDLGDGGSPGTRGVLTLATADAAALKWVPFSSKPRGEQVRSYSTAMHTGRLFGWGSAVFVLLGALATLAQVYTGFALSWGRFVGWRRRRARAAAAA